MVDRVYFKGGKFREVEKSRNFANSNFGRDFPFKTFANYSKFTYFCNQKLDRKGKDFTQKSKM